ncbi:MAG: phospholipid/cholesterol/gamma-HCH transport system substrate-binding protein [Actinomycetota bacterium]|nr:phospholipid/cholesterol/gamma-HCH transport system substrate-binding protein [Actinomycetota bacterium]
MIGRTVWLKIAAFTVVTLLGISYVLVHYIGIGRSLLGQSYTAYVDLADSGGIFTTASVTYRGIEIGRVGEITLRDKGIRVELDLDDKPQIPSDVRAVIGNGSALGEQYVDLQPERSGGPYLRGGSVIPESKTALPVSTATLLVSLDRLVNSVPKEDLRTLVDELGTGFHDTGPALQRLLDATGSLVGTANERSPESIRLIEDAQRVLDTQNDVGGDVVAFSRRLASFSAALKGADGDLRKLLDSGVGAAAEVTALDHSLDATLPITLGNLVSLGQVTAVRIPSVRQVLIVYPYIVATSFGLFPGDGTTRFGVPVPPSEDSQPCTEGYMDPKKRRLPDELVYPPIRYGSYCKAPTNTSVGPRGSRQAPQPGGGRLGDDPAYKNNTGLPRQSPEPTPPGSGGAGGLNADPAAVLSGPMQSGPYLLASTGGQQQAPGPGKEPSWSALILGPLS